MEKEDIQKALEALGKGGITVAGDLVLEKKVEYEVNNVEKGGIGIQIINGKRTDDESFSSEGDEVEEEDAEDEISNEATDTQEPPNYFAPTKNLQKLLKEDWFAKVRTKDVYNVEWTDAFVSALMESKWKDGIAKDWAVQGARNKKDQIKGYVVGLLKDAGVLKGSYDSIASHVGITDDPRTFSKYMGRGKKQLYADWVKDYVSGIRG
jgi:hypothetical protein